MPPERGSSSTTVHSGVHGENESLTSATSSTEWGKSVDTRLWIQFDCVCDMIS